MRHISFKAKGWGGVIMWIGFIIGVVILALSIPALIIMLAWNELLVDLAKSLRAITFWEALLMSLVLNMIFRPFLSWSRRD